MPPLDVLYLHRKLGGLYLLCTRLAASVNVGRLLQPYLAETCDAVSSQAQEVSCGDG